MDEPFLFVRALSLLRTFFDHSHDDRFDTINAVETYSKDGGRQEIQLKGSGRTPFSRSADGLAVLRSGVREYLCAEGESSYRHVKSQLGGR
jgi:hypothetical protein